MNFIAVRLTCTVRPYLLTFSSGSSYLLTSEDAQRVLDSEPIVSWTARRVVLQGGNDGKVYNRATLTPATLDGAVAFTRQESL